MEFASDALSKRLLGRAPDRVRTLVHRPDRSVYVATVGGDEFVCKVADDAGALAREAEGQRRARSAGIPVPEVIAAADGAIATRFVEGASLTGIRDVEAWRAAGRVLRRVHEVPPDGAWGEGLDAPAVTWRASVDIHLACALDDCVRDLGFDREQAARIRDAFAASPVFDAPAPAWCHGDCQPDHVLIDITTNEVAALIDWSDHGRADAAW